MFNAIPFRQFTLISILLLYSITCLKRPLKKKTKMVFKADYLFMKVNFAILLTFILLTFITLPFVIKIFVFPFFEWPLKTSFTVLMFQVCYVSKTQSVDGRLRYSSGCTLNQVY